MQKPAFLRGANLILRPILSEDITQRYLVWLNDAETNRFSRRSIFPTSEFEAKEYLTTTSKNEIILVICKKDDGQHIGNIKLGPINLLNRSAEISILIGEKTEWNKGYASEAIYLTTKHLFNKLGLNRVEAGTVNPAFEKLVINKLGWQKEGIFRKAFFLNGEFVDITRLSLLKNEFRQLIQFEEETI